MKFYLSRKAMCLFSWRTARVKRQDVYSDVVFRGSKGNVLFSHGVFLGPERQKACVSLITFILMLYSLGQKTICLF